jgi:hypothetical protein
MLKINVSTGPAARMVRNATDAFNAAVPKLVAEIAGDLAAEIRSERERAEIQWLQGPGKSLAEVGAPVELLRSLYAYLQQLAATVDSIGSGSSVLVQVDGARMSEVGYSTEILAKLLEFGGNISVAGKKYQVPPQRFLTRMQYAAARTSYQRAAHWARQFIIEVQTRLAALRD